MGTVAGTSASQAKLHPWWAAIYGVATEVRWPTWPVQCAKPGTGTAALDMALIDDLPQVQNLMHRASAWTNVSQVSDYIIECQAPDKAWAERASLR